jgi:hypothetical protein
MIVVSHDTGFTAQLQNFHEVDLGKLMK